MREYRIPETDGHFIAELHEAFDAEQVARKALLAAVGSHDHERWVELEQTYKTARAKSDRILGLRYEGGQREV